MTYPEATLHDLPLQIAEDLFVVYGSVMFAVVRATRNMAVVRHNDELTLINPVRMNDEGLAALDALGTVKHVLRLGSLHGMDDAFYVDRYQAEFWAFPGGTTYPEPNITRPLSAGGDLPFPDARLFAYAHLTEPEGVILLQRGNGILLTCDSVQSYATPPHKPQTSWIGRKLLTLIGFPDKTIIGPVWMKKISLDREATKAEFEEILAQDFDQLLSAHGTFLPSGAKQELQSAFDEMFG